MFFKAGKSLKMKQTLLTLCLFDGSKFKTVHFWKRKVWTKVSLIKNDLRFRFKQRQKYFSTQNIRSEKFLNDLIAQICEDFSACYVMLLSHSQRIMWIMKIAPLYCSCFENLWFKPAPVIFSISWRNFSWEARKIVLQGWISLHTQNVKYDMKPCDKYKIPPCSSFSRKTVWI